MVYFNVAKNAELRTRVNNLFVNFGVSKKFFAKEAGLDEGLFNRWTKNTKNYVDANLEKIETVLNDKYGQFKS